MESKTTYHTDTPHYFLELAQDCNEFLPAKLIAHVEFYIDSADGYYGVIVEKITGENGEEIDQSWLDEYAGYQFTLREQIKLGHLRERFPEQRI